RRAADRFATTAMTACLVLAATPLVLILGYIVIRGSSSLSHTFFTHSMNGVTGSEPGGGLYHALLGTVQQVGLAAAIALTIVSLADIFILDFGRGVFARLVTFFVSVINDLTSIVSCLFVFSSLLLYLVLRPFVVTASLA